MAGDRVTDNVRHLGIIPDGGRRWARINGLPLEDSYKLSMNKLEQYIDAFYSNGIRSVSLYMLSRWNLDRDPEDLQPVVMAESLFLETIVPSLRERWSLTVKIAGELAPLPERLRNSATKVDSSSSPEGRTLFLCVGYDPFDELRHARSTGSGWLTRDDVLKTLWVSQEIDVVIRTGGASTLSHFLPLQAGYARLIFVEKLFNDTNVQDFLDIIEDQRRRNFSFGK